MALTDDEVTLLNRHKIDLDAHAPDDALMHRYFQGEQAIEQLGMAVPPTFARFLLVVNWPGMYVESVEARQDVRALMLPDEEKADPKLDAIWDANNLNADLSMFLQDRYIYGRAFMSVGSNEDHPDLPLIHVESPREMTAFMDARQRRMTSACRFYGSIGSWLDRSDPSLSTGSTVPLNATLYLPNETIWAQRDTSVGQWVAVDRDQHRLGRVPVTMSLCRRRSGSWRGTSLMQRVNSITDAAARTLTNMQFAVEAHGVPQRYALGVQAGDFVGPDGALLPKWQAYYNAVWANASPDVKVGQFSASDLKNFETAITLYGKLAASVTLLPSRYFGLTTTNPPSADSIRAEEAQMVKFVERQNSQVGSVLGDTAGLALQFTGIDVDGSRIGVQWIDPSTPTIAQREDALMKRRSVGVLSRQGYWDELGWSEQRKATEQGYLDEEAASDPIVTATRQLSAGPTATPMPMPMPAAPDAPASNA